MSADEEPLSTVSVLADPTRRDLYRLVRRAGRAVSREEAADQQGISRKLAAFHLDKLVTAGLLASSSTRLPGPARRGRKPKMYEPTDAELHVSIPPRQYKLFAEIMFEAVRVGGSDPRAVVRRIALERGLAIGEAARDRTRPGRLGPERSVRLVEQVLSAQGYDPSATKERLQLVSCPFHRFVEGDPELVCGLNHALLRGILQGLQVHALEAVLSPGQGDCCVTIHQSSPSPSQDWA